MNDLRAWKFRPGSDNKTVEKVITTGRVSLDYEISGLLSDISREDLISKIRTHNPDRPDQGVRARAGQILNLFHTVTKGDIAIIPRNKGKSMMIGEIVSDGPAVSGTCVEVQVKWIDTDVPLSRFNQDLRYSFMAIHKLCMVSRNNAPERLKRIANGEPDPGFWG